MAIKITPEQVEKLFDLAALAGGLGLNLAPIRANARQMVADGQPLDSVMYFMEREIKGAKGEAAKAVGKGKKTPAPAGDGTGV